jgi:assimilatory nitrate reductase catalytic subunit
VFQWAEEDGTMTNLEGRVIRRRRAIAPPAGVRDELWILAELARRLECTATFDTDPELVFEELRLASEGGIADYSGIDYAMLDRGEAAYWPYPRGSAGTPRLFADRFAHPDGRAKLVAVTVRASAHPAPQPGELTLVTGRLLEHYQSGAQTRRVPELDAAQPEALAALHPSTADRLGIADGDDVEVANTRGTVRCRARVTTDIRPDAVFLPFHYADAQAANLLTSDAVDPISSMPEFKTNLVRVTRVARLTEAGVPT